MYRLAEVRRARAGKRQVALIMSMNASLMSAKVVLMDTRMDVTLRKSEYQKALLRQLDGIVAEMEDVLNGLAVTPDDDEPSRIEIAKSCARFGELVKERFDLISVMKGLGQSRSNEHVGSLNNAEHTLSAVIGSLKLLLESIGDGSVGSSSALDSEIVPSPCGAVKALENALAEVGKWQSAREADLAPWAKATDEAANSLQRQLELSSRWLSDELANEKPIIPTALPIGECIGHLMEAMTAEQKQQQIIEERANANFPHAALVKSVLTVLAACEGRLETVTACSEVLAEFEERMAKVGEVEVEKGSESCIALQRFVEASNALAHLEIEKARLDELMEKATRVLVGLAQDAFPEVRLKAEQVLPHAFSTE